ncbi:MAG: hypothetical protein KatS3mg034_0845 [Vicingaceae bacterium]|nr:MAG: hypothetical protein KatS3mg034_0845 [Vicingaceae bacterium]
MMATAYNKLLSGSGFQPSPKSPSATSDTRKMLVAMAGPAATEKILGSSLKSHTK